jgi:phage tail-like protein
MPAPEFKVNSTRYDPYKTYRFRVYLDGRYVAGISKVSGLTRTSQVITHRAGGDPTVVRRSPGQTEFVAITLERGVTHDTAFDLWANKVWNYKAFSASPGSANQIVPLDDFRKDIVIELHNESGRKVLAYKVYRCWVSEYQAMPELDGSGNAVAIQSIKLENEGWEQDDSVAETTEPGFTLPEG